MMNPEEFARQQKSYTTRNPVRAIVAVVKEDGGGSFKNMRVVPSFPTNVPPTYMRGLSLLPL
jgi:hypothetical protein